AVRFALAEDLGSIEVVVEGRQVGETITAVKNLPKNARPAAEFLLAGPPSIRGLLRGVIVVDDLAEAQKLWPSFSGAGSVLVTRTGEVLSQYTLRGGSGTGVGRIELLAERDAA